VTEDATSDVAADPAPAPPPAEPAPGARRAPLIAAGVAAAAAGALAVAALAPAAVTAVVAVLQVLLVAAVVLGTRLPGRYGAAAPLVGAAIAADVALTVWSTSALHPLLGVLALAIPVLFAHQLMRGTGRTALVASLSGLAATAVGVVSLAAWMQLAREDGGTRLGAGAAIAVGAALATALAIDALGLGPRIEPDSPPTVAGLILGALVGAIAGGAVLGSGESMHLVAGGAVALALAIVAVLLGLAATMTARAAAAGGLAPAARPVLLVVPVLAAVGPVAYLLCLAAQG
jgi:hypothetical protein